MEWRTVFVSGAVVLFVTNLFFVVFGSAETQPWNSSRNGKVFITIIVIDDAHV